MAVCSIICAIMGFSYYKSEAITTFEPWNHLYLARSPLKKLFIAKDSAVSFCTCLTCLRIVTCYLSNGQLACFVIGSVTDPSHRLACSLGLYLLRRCSCSFFVTSVR